MACAGYGGVEADVAPLTQWTPEEIDAHLTYQKDLNAELEERGEFIDARGLSSPKLAKFVVADGQSPPVVTDGPFIEAKELLAGFRMIDVESIERALEIAALGSAAPGPGGVRLTS